MVHQPVTASRAGASAPRIADCAATAITRPDSSARRLPVADSTSRRLAQPRVMIMPAPKHQPADDRARQAAALGELARFRNVKQHQAG